jgi:hypothetical protein
MADPGVLTTGAVARRYGVPLWKVRRLFERGILPDTPRAGTYRLIPIADLPIVEKALRDARYLQTETPACA